MGIIKLIIILIIGLFVAIPILGMVTDGFTGEQKIVPYKYSQTNTDLSMMLLRGN